MATNVNPAISPSIQPTSRTSETKTDKIVVNRDGGSSSGFAKQTDVKFTNSVDNMSAVLEKISTSTLNTDNGLPQQLRDMINNVVTKAFSLESSLGEGLGSAMASERYSVEQLTSLGRIFQQLGNMAEANAVAGEVVTETSASQLSDALQAMMANVKTAIANSALGGNTADLELVQLTKLAFQILNNGNADSVPDNMSQLLKLLSSQNSAGSASQNDSQQAAVNEDILSNASSSAGNNVSASQPNQQGNSLKQLVDLLFPKMGNSNQNGANQANNSVLVKQAANAYNASNTANSAAGGNLKANSTVAADNNALGQQSGKTPTLQGNVGQAVNNGAENQAQASQNEAAMSQPANAKADSQTVTNTAGKNAQLNAATETLDDNKAANASTETLADNKANAGKEATSNAKVVDNQGQNNQGGISPRVLKQAAEIENNPLFRQIFSRYGYSQETGIVKQTTQTMQQEMPQLPNNQQVVDSFRNLAELLLKDSNLTAKDTALLKNFINSTQGQLSEQDAKQLNMLLKMVQSNVPAAIQQAGQQQGMEGLPKLWAFLQLADLGSLRDLKAKDFKNAKKEIKTVVSSMKNSITSEGSYQADGQKSISFVMPLYIGEGGHSYPAYINLYDEPEHEDEHGRKRKDTWFRVCVLTDNIGAVDIVCQLFEGNNLNLRINFSDQEVVQDFGEYLPDIRKALLDTSIHLNDLRIGAVN